MLNHLCRQFAIDPESIAKHPAALSELAEDMKAITKKRAIRSGGKLDQPDSTTPRGQLQDFIRIMWKVVPYAEEFRIRRGSVAVVGGSFDLVLTHFCVYIHKFLFDGKDSVTVETDNGPFSCQLVHSSGLASLPLAHDACISTYTFIHAQLFSTWLKVTYPHPPVTPQGFEIASTTRPIVRPPLHLMGVHQRRTGTVHALLSGRCLCVVHAHPHPHSLSAIRASLSLSVAHK